MGTRFSCGTDGSVPSIAERFQGGSKSNARFFKPDFPSGRAHDDGQPAICHLGTCAVTSCAPEVHVWPAMEAFWGPAKFPVGVPQPKSKPEPQSGAERSMCGTAP